MKNARLVLPLTLFAPAVLAQEHTIAIKPQGETPTRYTITSSSKIESQMKTMIDGEEMTGRGGGRGRGAPQGPASAEQKVVFVDAGTWRQYETVEAKVTRPGWDGETNEQTVTGELQGKKVTFSPEPAIVGEDDKATPIPANAARGLPRKIDFSALAPSKPLAVDGTYEIGPAIKQALASLVHPVRAARPEGGRGDRAGGGRGNRERGEGGRGGEGGDAGGGRRGMGRGMMIGGADNVALQILTAEGTQPKLTGKLVKVENDVATIEITGQVTGKGDPQKLGIGFQMPMRGRRGGDEGGEAPAQPAGDGSVRVDVNGTMQVHVATGALQSLALQGKLESNSHTERTQETQDGETREFTVDRMQKGDFSVQVAAAPAK